MENVGEFIVNHWLLVTLFVVLIAMIMSDQLNRKISGVNPIGSAEAIQIVNQHKGRFVDIREVDEFNNGHIADSIHLPLSSLADKVSSLKKPERPVIVVCASGQRARKAAKQLSSHGFTDIYVLKGGLTTWKEAKLPLFS